MMKLSSWNTICAVLLLVAASGQAQTFNTIVVFDNADGLAPIGSLVQGPEGNLYGTAGGGGGSGQGMCFDGCGLIFKVTSKGELTTVYAFCKRLTCPDGFEPYSNLVLASDGNFYGTTYYGGGSSGCKYGCGTVFKVTPRGKLTTLHAFNGSDGAEPYGSLVQGTDGNFYGTTVYGGSDSCQGTTCGTIFRMTPEGALTSLYSFCPGCGDGYWPYAGLVEGSDGNFYGTTSEFYGTVFKITPQGKFTTLHSFVGYPIEGYGPNGGLVQAGDGNFYGTTFYGYDSVGCTFYYPGCGTIFRMTPAGAVATVDNFNYNNGAFPTDTLIQATDGNLYGNAAFGGPGQCGGGAGCGTIFYVSREGRLIVLEGFNGGNGASPNSALVQATSGIFYGTTTEGGDYTNCPSTGCGTVFSLDTGLGPFVTFIHPAGEVGQTGGILGQGFTGTSNVSLNGIQASFTVVSDTFIRATVPSGATTGYVTVTTPTGVLTSNVPFHVIP
jgi:uncharacterized repeat protein (TIGR03803 family)